MIIRLATEKEILNVVMENLFSKIYSIPNAFYNVEDQIIKLCKFQINNWDGCDVEVPINIINHEEIHLSIQNCEGVQTTIKFDNLDQNPAYNISNCFDYVTYGGNGFTREFYFMQIKEIFRVLKRYLSKSD